MSDPSEPPPSYEEAQGMTTGPGQYPQQYPQPDAYQAGKPFEGYSGTAPYPTQAGQPGQYPPQTGYAQQPYPYGQPAVPLQGVYPPPPPGQYPQGSYVHPTVGYNPNAGATVYGNPPVMAPGQYGVPSLEAQRRKKILIGTFATILVVIFFIVMTMQQQTYGVGSPEDVRKKKVLMGTVTAVIVVIFFIIMFTVIF